MKEATKVDQSFVGDRLHPFQVSGPSRLLKQGEAMANKRECALWWWYNCQSVMIDEQCILPSLLPTLTLIPGPGKCRSGETKKGYMPKFQIARSVSCRASRRTKT